MSNVYQDWLVKYMTKWSIELSMFMTVCLTLMTYQLMDLDIVKIYLIVIFSFMLGAILCKFSLQIIKNSIQSIQCIKNEYKTPENKVKSAVKTITSNLPLIEPEKENPDNIDIETPEYSGGNVPE